MKGERYSTKKHTKSPLSHCDEGPGISCLHKLNGKIPHRREDAEAAEMANTQDKQRRWLCTSCGKVHTIWMAHHMCQCSNLYTLEADLILNSITMQKTNKQ